MDGPKAKEIVKLNSNEMQLGPSPKAMEAMHDEIKRGHLYPRPVVLALKAKVAEYVGKELECVTMYCGADAAIQTICETFLNHDDELLVCSPTYMLYYKLPFRFGAKLAEAHSSDGVSTDLDEFVEKLPPHVICVIDEAYYDWITEENYESALRFVNDRNNVIVLRTFSKIYGMAGLRVGYSVANKDITACLGCVSTYYNANRIGAAGAIAALDDEKFRKKAFDNNKEQKEYITKELEKMGVSVVPSQASFIYFNPHCDADLCTKKLEDYGVFIRPIDKTYTRVTIGLPHQNRIFLDALREVLAEIKRGIAVSECIEPVKVRIFQSDVNGGNLTRENLLNIWKEKLSAYPGLDVSYYGRMKMDDIDEEVGDADAVIAYSRHKKCGDKYEFIEQVTLDELLNRSDVISIHCPLTEESRNMIDADAIARMKDGVILINTARGEIIDENALKDALDSKKISAAGLDVVCGEPLDGPIPLMQCDNTRITQHIAFATPEAKIRAIEIAADNLINWYKGTPTSVIM